MPTNTGSRLRPTGSNRRNHYRTLHAQPDAPFEVIKANYRTLMQKLKGHPDLGGDHWTAVHVNTAYEILSDPVRRSAYDRELLASYDIATLSRGQLQPKSRSATRARPTSPGNQRNFYRVLQVQPDAPIELIEASHRAISARPSKPSESLAQAMATLRDPARRHAYDRTLGLVAAGGKAPTPTTADVGSTSRRQPAMSHWGAYEAVVTRYCLFCKTPHQASRTALAETGCVECGSPLFPPQADFLEEARRSLGRSPQSEEIGFYTFWPGTRFSGRLLDLSPTGLRFLTQQECARGDIIKIDAKRLQAVGAVAHHHRDRSGTTAGVSFHSVGFRVPRGSFVSAHV
jgi:curved DNA-binding protein CbpA